MTNGRYIYCAIKHKSYDVALLLKYEVTKLFIYTIFIVDNEIASEIMNKTVQCVDHGHT